MVEEVSRPADGKLGRSGETKADGLAIAHGAQAKTPGLDVDAVIPEAGLNGGDGDVYGTGDVEGDPVVAGSCVRRVHGLAVDGDRKGSGFELRRDGRGLHAGSGIRRYRKRENHSKQTAKTRQETMLRRESGDQTTLAPRASDLTQILKNPIYGRIHFCQFWFFL